MISAPDREADIDIENYCRITGIKDRRVRYWIPEGLRQIEHLDDDDNLVELDLCNVEELYYIHRPLMSFEKNLGDSGIKAFVEAYENYTMEQELLG